MCMGYLTVSVFLIFSVQKKEAEHPKVEVVQEEEEVVHEDNEWGELSLYLFIFSCFVE